MTDDLARKMHLAEIATVREHLGEQQQAAVPDETGEQRADREETERNHARGDHTHCGVQCEAIIPTDHLRNMLLYRALPGAKGALAELERRAAAKAAPVADLPARLEATLTERYTELGNPFSRMRRQEQGPDGWPASHPVGPHHVAETLRELLTEQQPAAEQPFVPPAHYRRDDGADCCVHAIPVGPNSCAACRELADAEAAAGARQNGAQA
ncbi:hypothetical protein ACFWIK_00725 [Streptomyces anthocyanicus]|uniref:hypothetical protein n=1 Tax=Streptomyces anthocyanicus TaxID=68174 RepID=UPI00365592D1